MAHESPPSIASIAVSGFKSIADEQSIEIRPLTILAGANSSGKSSIMQPLLLLKQTAEATFDPGPLLLDGPHVRFTSASQMMTRVATRETDAEFAVRILDSNQQGIRYTFRKSPERLQVALWEVFVSGARYVVDPPDPGVERFYIGRDWWLADHHRTPKSNLFLLVNVTIVQALIGTIHLAGLRGNAERSYSRAGHGPYFPGPFERYAASVIRSWNSDQIASLSSDLAHLGLTSSVSAMDLDDTRVELRVGRTLASDASDLVNIADVGVGVSQTLPVLVALLAAEPGRLVYIEQPEIHLHPRAQVAMGAILAKAAKRGVKVVIETHSSLLLLGIQSQVAEGNLPPDLVKLHWFTRSPETGATTVTSADLDEAGRFGDWPEDFDDVSLKAQAHYLDVAEARLAKKA